LLGERIARRYGTRATHLSASVTCQKSPRAQWWSCAITSKSSGTNIIKSHAGKRYWPHLRICCLSRGGAGGHSRYPVDRVPLCTRLKRSAPWLQRALAPPRARGTEHATCQKRAPVSPCAPWHRASHPPGKGSGVARCLEAPCMPPARKGLRCCHVPRGTEPITWKERALESPCASWLQAHPLCRKALALPRDRGTRTST
jgi:hypothetical protein